MNLEILKTSVLLKSENRIV